MSILFKSVTATSICFLCLLISTFNSTNYVTSPFFVLSALKTSNDLSIISILILSSLTNYLTILIWVHPEFTSTCNCNFFSFFVLMLVYVFNSLTLLFYQFRITYWFWELLFCCIVLTLNLNKTLIFVIIIFIRFFLNSSTSHLLS